VLEIYLNVIEWGPGVYGLRPAARHYFAREPMRLTPKQMAFLVSLVPGPIKYQRSFEGGVVTPFFEGLVATLLAKLRSVDALTEEEYAAALAEPLGLRVGIPADAAADGAGGCCAASPPRTSAVRRSRSVRGLVLGRPRHEGSTSEARSASTTRPRVLTAALTPQRGRAPARETHA
jgi:membrane peptidoglycan carboxypeptidase